MRIGITGSRHELTPRQTEALYSVLLAAHELTDHRLEVHHGLCTGADHAAHRLTRELSGAAIYGHPGHDSNRQTPFRADIPANEFDWLYESKLYRERNRDIINTCQSLIACPVYPENDSRSQRSGTWQTIRLARARNLDITYVWPNGSITREPFPETT